MEKTLFIKLSAEKQIETLTIKPQASLSPIIEKCFKTEYHAQANNFIMFLAYYNKYRQAKSKLLKLQALETEKSLACESLTEAQENEKADLEEMLRVYKNEFLAKYDNSNPFADDEQALYICYVCASYISKVWTIVDGTSELYKLASTCHKENIDTYNGKNQHFKAVYNQLETITNTLATDETTYLNKRKYNVSSTETKFFIGTLVVVKPNKAKQISLQLKSEKAFRNDVIACLYGKLQGQKLDAIEGLHVTK